MGPAHVCNAPNAIGIATEKCAVILAEKGKIGRKSQGMTAVSRGVGCVLNGSLERANWFVKPIVSAARDFYITHRHEPMFLQLAEATNEFSHLPRINEKLGFKLLAICCDPIDGPQLWKMENDATYASLGIASVGTHAEEVMYQTMNKNFDTWDHEEIIVHLLKSLRAGLEEDSFDAQFLEIGLVTTSNPLFQHLEPYQVKSYVEKAFTPQQVPEKVIEDDDDDSSDSEHISSDSGINT